MELQITGKNIELTPEVRGYIERKLGKFSRRLPNLIKSSVEVSEEQTRSPQQHYIVQVTVDGGSTTLRGEDRGKDIFTAVDKVAVVLNRQIEHHKGKLYDKGRGNSLARSEFDEIEAQPRRKVVKVKRFIVNPMSATEAAKQMELLGHNFFLFLNADTDELSLLYRRHDGDYGLIEPELE